MGKLLLYTSPFAIFQNAIVMSESDLRFPVGKLIIPELVDNNSFNSWIDVISAFPEQVKKEVESLNEEQLHWRYRPGGWNILQVVHHCADSHMNSFIRFKLTLTEERPTIKPYFEDRWAALPDTTQAPISQSIAILEGLHARWVILLKDLSNAQKELEFLHPEYEKPFKLGQFTAVYDWHCRHHLAHIIQAKIAKGSYNS